MHLHGVHGPGLEIVIIHGHVHGVEGAEGLQQSALPKLLSEHHTPIAHYRVLDPVHVLLEEFVVKGIIGIEPGDGKGVFFPPFYQGSIGTYCHDRHTGFVACLKSVGREVHDGGEGMAIFGRVATCAEKGFGEK